MFSLREGEMVEKAVRRHWFVMAGPAIGTLIACLLPPILLVLILWLGEVMEADQPLEIGGSLLWLLSSLYLLWCLLVVLYFFITWTTYYLDVWYITNQRLVDVDQKWLFIRSTKSLRFERIQDVTVEVSGILATLLKFGTVHVQTAGATRQIDIKQVNRPYELRKIVLDQHDRATKTFYKLHQKDHIPSGTAGSGEEPEDSDEGLS